MSGFEFWPEIGSAVLGMVVSGIGSHLERRQEVPMAEKTLTHPFGGFCSVQNCNDEAVAIDHENYVVCERHAEIQRQHLVQAQAQYAQLPPQPQGRPAQSAYQQRIDSHDAATMRDRHELARPSQYRDEEEYEGDYLDGDEFYEEDKDLCMHGQIPDLCRSCFVIAQRSHPPVQSRQVAAPRSRLNNRQRPVSPQPRRQALEQPVERRGQRPVQRRDNGRQQRGARW